MRVVAIVPTFNEAANLAPLVARIRANQPLVDILVVDDDSEDGTGRIADGLADDEHVHVLHRAGQSGLGLSYLDGYAWAAARGYDALVQLDADGSHRPEEMERLLAPLREARADLVIGSRWVDGGRVVNWPRRRLWLSRGANSYARRLLALPSRDVTAGYRAVRIADLGRLELDSVQSHGYCFQVDITRRATEAGLRIAEVPITFVERVRGESKMRGPIVVEAMWRVTGWGIGRRLRRLWPRRPSRRPR